MPIQPTTGQSPPASFWKEPTAFSWAFLPIAISASMTDEPMTMTRAM